MTRRKRTGYGAKACRYGELPHKVLRADPSRVLDVVPAELGFLNA